MASRKPTPEKAEADPTFIDRDNAFMLYATFCGDVERTAHALKIQPVDVLRIADADHWNEKLKSIIELKKSSRPGDIERAINRAINFVQAARFRHLVERAIRRLYEMDDEEFDNTVFRSVTLKGEIDSRLSAKGLADLATAMEKAQAMSYHALNDTATERTKRADVEEGGASAADFHIRIADAMAKVGGSNSIRAELFDQQLEAARNLLKESNQPIVDVEPNTPTGSGTTGGVKNSDTPQ